MGNFFQSSKSTSSSISTSSSKDSPYYPHYSKVSSHSKTSNPIFLHSRAPLKMPATHDPSVRPPFEDPNRQVSPFEDPNRLVSPWQDQTLWTLTSTPDAASYFKNIHPQQTLGEIQPYSPQDHRILEYKI